MKREDTKINSPTRMTKRGERGINCSTRTQTGLDKRRKKKQEEGRGKKSKREIIKPGKGYIRCPKHKRSQPIAKATHYGGHNKKKDYNEGMGSHNCIIKLIITKKGTRSA